MTFYALLRSVANNDHVKPFVLTLVLIFLGYSGLGISLWPNIIPPAVSIWDAAAPPQSQGFMLVGALFIIPFILVYTAWSYYVFRGKVKHRRWLSLMAAPTSLPSWRSRLLWLLLIWAGGVASLGLAAGALRLVMRAIGMST